MDRGVYERGAFIRSFMTYKGVKRKIDIKEPKSNVKEVEYRLRH